MARTDEEIFRGVESNHSAPPQLASILRSYWQANPRTDEGKSAFYFVLEIVSWIAVLTAPLAFFALVVPGLPGASLLPVLDPAMVYVFLFGIVVNLFVFASLIFISVVEDIKDRTKVLLGSRSLIEILYLPASLPSKARSFLTWMALLIFLPGSGHWFLSLVYLVSYALLFVGKIAVRDAIAKEVDKKAEKDSPLPWAREL